MISIHPQFITDQEGNKLSVVLPIEEYEQILEELDDLEDIKLYDEAKNDNIPSMSFDDYVQQRRAK